MEASGSVKGIFREGQREIKYDALPCFVVPPLFALAHFSQLSSSSCPPSAAVFPEMPTDRHINETRQCDSKAGTKWGHTQKNNIMFTFYSSECFPSVGLSSTFPRL